MSQLGLRFHSQGFCYVILGGTKSAPTIELQNSVRIPKNFGKAQVLRWVYQEIQDIITRQNVSAICMKGPEGLAARNTSFVERIEMEAIVYLAAFDRGVRAIEKKVKSTMAKDLGQKGRAKYLSTMDTSSLPGYDELDEKLQEAALAAWSEL